MQIINSGTKLTSAEKIAQLRGAVSKDGRRVYARYRDGKPQERLSWLNRQLFGLALIAHTNVDAVTVKVDITNLDGEIMANRILRDLTLIEIQAAFRNGINGDYGDYFGLSSVSLLKFLKGYLRSEAKIAASAIAYNKRIKAEQEANAQFFRKLYEAQEEGKIQLPDFSHMRVNGED